MLCIICNGSSETHWPKRWKCWKENGKFSESLCKLLGLPKYPYEKDFQQFQYCTLCQKKVYNVYLVVRKWEKLQDDISKLKVQLERDFQESLDKFEVRRGNDPVTIDKVNTTNKGDKDERKERNGLENIRPKYSSSEDEQNRQTLNIARRRILKRLTWSSDCDCKNCYRKDGESDHDGDDAGNSCCSSNEDEEKSTYCNCKACFNSKDHTNEISRVCCTSEYCADCTICNNDAIHQNRRRNNGKLSLSAQNQQFEAEQEAKTSALDLDGTQVLPEESKKSDKFKCSGSKKGLDNKRKSSVLMPSTTEGNAEKLGDSNLLTENVPTADTEYYVERFRCYRDNCIRTFATKDELNIHIKRHHEGVKCPYTCQECGKTFQWRRQLDAHQLKHSGGVEICCHICGRGFRTQRLFHLHMKTKHVAERKYKCSHCDKSFISQSKLKTHMTIHTKTYPFTCTTCGKGFAAKTFLNFHTAKHMEYNPYKCITCAKTFSTPRNLQVHQLTHTNSYPFNCNICQIGVSTQALLKSHMLKHSPEKNNLCEICNKRFRFPSSLKKHIKVHMGDKRFHCPICEKAFVDKYKLTRHQNTHVKNHKKHAVESNDNPKDSFQLSSTKSDEAVSSYFPTVESFSSLVQHDMVPDVSDNPNLEDTLMATIQFDDLPEPLILSDAFEQQQADILDLNSSPMHIMSSFQQSGSSDIFGSGICTFPFTNCESTTETLVKYTF